MRKILLFFVLGISSLVNAQVGYDLPLVIIDTKGNTIPDEPGIIVEIGIIDNGVGNLNYETDPFNDYNGYADIEIRGQSSQSFPKNNYGFETTTSAGVDIDTSLLGFPVEEDWILHGPYSDKSLIRNPLAMNIARGMGYYASRTKHCELIVNNEYLGVYVLMEKIKRDKNRVDIAKLESFEISGDDVTGGYIFRIDKGFDPGWKSQYGIFSLPSKPWKKIKFKYVYPKAVNIMPEQETYIKSYVDEMELALASSDFTYEGNRYDDYLDVNSFVDNFIINEVSKNVDAYRISSYFYKDKTSKGGKLFSMPVWDYNLAFFNGDYCNGDTYTGWMYDEHCDDGNSFWLDQMRKDTAFQDLLKCRWDNWRSSVLDTNNLFNYIDSLSSALGNAQARNFTKWPILGTYVWPNPTPVPTTYQEEIDQIKDFLRERIAWMDDNITGNPDCGMYESLAPTLPPTPTLILATSSSVAEENSINIYPNPALDFINIECSTSKIADVKIYNVIGKQVDYNKVNEFNKIDISSLTAGVYFISVKTSNGELNTIKIIKR